MCSKTQFYFCKIGCSFSIMISVYKRGKSPIENFILRMVSIRPRTVLGVNENQKPQNRPPFFHRHSFDGVTINIVSKKKARSIGDRPISRSSSSQNSVHLESLSRPSSAKSPMRYNIPTSTKTPNLTFFYFQTKFPSIPAFKSVSSVVCTSCPSSKTCFNMKHHKITFKI